MYRWLLTALFTGMFRTFLHGQTAFAPPSQADDDPAALQQLRGLQNQSALPAVPSPLLGAARPGQRRGLFELGPVAFRPAVNYRFLYGTGILRLPGQTSASWLQELNPALSLGIGNFWELNYSPTFSYYSAREFRDTMGQSAALRGTFTVDNWAFGLSQSYNLSSQPLIETARQTEQQFFGTSITARRPITHRTSIDLSINQSIQESEGFSNSRSWSANGWWNYQVVPKLQAGIGIGLGYVNVEGGTDMTHEQLQARLSWIPTTRVSIELSGGGEMRQFLDFDGSGRPNPLFSASVNWRPWAPTTLRLAGSRSVNASVFGNQITESTELNASLHQRFLGKVYADLSLGYRSSEFQQAGQQISLARTDEYFFVRSRLSVVLHRTVTVGIFWQVSENSSSLPGFGFNSNQVGFDIGYRF